jgi:hypothetical protein
MIGVGLHVRSEVSAVHVAMESLFAPSASPEMARGETPDLGWMT